MVAIRDACYGVKVITRNQSGVAVTSFFSRNYFCPRGLYIETPLSVGANPINIEKYTAQQQTAHSSIYNIVLLVLRTNEVPALKKIRVIHRG